MSKEIVPIDQIAQSIYVLRGQKVMLDSDLAALYGVEARVLNQAVKRNAARFPGDFMFRLSSAETRFLRSQFVTLKRQNVDPQGFSVTSSQFVMSSRGMRYRPYAFSEQGVAMLSSVLNSERAGERGRPARCVTRLAGHCLNDLVAPPQSFWRGAKNSGRGRPRSPIYGR